ncbi:MAG: acyltransferase family protein, partial [Mucilaginibacter sp.]
GNVMFVRLCMYTFWRGPVIILIGSVFAICMFKNMITLKRGRINHWLGIVLLSVAIVMRTPNFLFYTKYISQYLSTILIAFVVLLALQPDTLLTKVFSSKLMVRIGILSYSLYIWQQLFVGSNPWQPWMRRLYGYPMWQLIILKLVAAFFIAICSYAFERRFLKIKDRFKYRQIGDASSAQHVVALEA